MLCFLLNDLAMDDLHSCLLQVWFFPFLLFTLGALLEVISFASSELVEVEFQHGLH
jgi:hypothetical protein